MEYKKFRKASVNIFKNIIVYIYIYIYIYNKIINATLVFVPIFSWTQRSKTFSMYTKGLFLSNIHKSV